MDEIDELFGYKTRLDKLKAINSIFASSEVTIDDLNLKDENGQTFFEYIVLNNISIYDNNLLKYITNNYDMLLFATENKYFFDKYYNTDLLFDESRGMSIIERIYLKRSSKVGNMSIDIINRLFDKVSGNYMFKKLLDHDKYSAVDLINRINNFDVLYKCLSDIDRLDLMKHSNENCLLSKTPNGKTMLEELIDNEENVGFNRIGYRGAEILFNKGQYNKMLELDASILMNYPDKNNNYLNMLIDLSKQRDDIFFNKAYFHSDNKKDLASLYITLLRNNVDFDKKIYGLIDAYDYSNKKPLLLHMLEMDKELTVKYFDTEENRKDIEYYLTYKMDADKDTINIQSISDIFNYIPNVQTFLKRLKTEEIDEITINDIYRDDLLHKMDDGSTILDYLLKNKIKVYSYFNPETIDETLVLLKYKDYINLSEELLYEKLNNGKLLIDFLMQHKCYKRIQSAINCDLRVMDYCVKYDCYSVLNDSIINELFVMHDGSFLGEKYLDNPKFVKEIMRHKFTKEKMLKLYDKGYTNLLCSADEETLLAKRDGKTILEKMLDDGSVPTFNGYDFESPETIEILKRYNKPELLYNASLELLMNYPDKENNYLQYLIDCHKKGINVNFELKDYRSSDKELLARCYIQMARNDLVAYLNKLEESDLVLDRNYHTLSGAKEKSLLYYLIKLDKGITLRKILDYKLMKSKRIFTELKLLGVEEGLLDVSYAKYNCADMCINTFNDTYTSGIISPVEEKLVELRKLFEKDGKSDMGIVDALILSYRYSTSVNPMFIVELDKLIEVKKKNPDFYYFREKDSGYFNRYSKKVVVENPTISTLNHETGHALHSFLTDYAYPSEYEDLLISISQSSDWVSRVDEYAEKFTKIKIAVLESAVSIVSKHVKHNDSDDDIKNINTLLSEEKGKLIEQYVERGYSRETLDVILSGTFTVDEFIKQKKKIETSEVVDAILRTEFDALISIGDIVDAISDGRFKSSVLKTSQGKKIKPAYGHGIRYYTGSDKKDTLETKFTEMIANYSTIIKSKGSNEILELLRYTVGDELVDMLDQFYHQKMLGETMQRGVSK